MKKLVLAGGGKEGFSLIAPLFDALKKSGSCNTVAVLPDGTNENKELSACFGMESAYLTLELTGTTPTERLGAAMRGMEKIIGSEKPDLVLACGDDDIALGAAIAASRFGLSVAAIDAGLRNYERNDPREVNRVLIDAIAELHFVSEHSGAYNLINEGVPDEKVFFAGNLLIDSLAGLMRESGRLDAAGRFGFRPGQYAIAVLDPSGRSVHAGQDETLLKLLHEISGKIPLLVFFSDPPGGPFNTSDFEGNDALRLIDKPGPGELLTLLRDAAFLLSENGELQAESTVMNVPCLTMMERTFRPSTIEIGTNVLVGDDSEGIIGRIGDILLPDTHGHRQCRSKIPEKWDGAAAGRIVAVLDRIV